jgi:hypothetical protein
MWPQLWHEMIAKKEIALKKSNKRSQQKEHAVGNNDLQNHWAAINREPWLDSHTHLECPTLQDAH